MNIQLNADDKLSPEEKTVIINLLVFQEQNTTTTDPKNEENDAKNVAQPYQLIYLPENIKKTSLKSKKSIKKRLESETDQKSKPLYKLRKKLNVGWLHCPKEGRKFTQVRAINGGGLKFMELSRDEKPSLDDFLRLAKRLFFKDKSVTPYGPMDEMDFFIGNFEGEKISHFTNTRGETCDVWEYMQSRGLSPSRINFYLLSQTKDVSRDDKPKQTEKCDQKPEKTDENDEKNEVYVFVPKLLRVTFMMRLDDVSGHIVNMMTSSKSSCFTDAVARGLVSRDAKMEDFHPTEVGYEIVQITLGDTVFFSVEYENACKKFHFHVTEEEKFIPHSIVHQPDELLGIDDDGTLATAVITSCGDECRPVLTWFCDGEVYAKGEKLFYVTLSKSATYHCEVKCEEMKCEVMSNVIFLS